MCRLIYISDENLTAPEWSGKVCFDTGLDPRSFARTKMSQSIIEPGFIVFPDGTHKEWKASGVTETSGFMRVWGPMSSGKRLDLLLDECDCAEADSLAIRETPLQEARQAALHAVTSWIRAKLFLGETNSALNPGASFILEPQPSLKSAASETRASPLDRSVFFAPEHLANRCLYAEGLEQDRYNNPDLSGINAAAFCAGVMLYKILTGSHPFTTSDFYQDMREGIFLPPSLAVPEMDEELSTLIQSVLLLPVKKPMSKTGTDILTRILRILSVESVIFKVSSLFKPISEEKKAIIEKEKRNFLIKQNSITGTKRFVTRNKSSLIAAGVALFFALIIILSVIQSISNRPTTEGLTSDGVITAYYDAFSELNHMFMEACIKGADKGDINTAASFYAVTKTRQAYEFSTAPILVTAKNWLENGGELPAPNVFGVTDLTIENISGSENENLTKYRVNYLLWAPYEQSISRTDTLTLRRDKRGNWRIIDIQRIER